MLPFQWNALRTGDRVLVHDDLLPGLDTEEGVVTIVQTRRNGSNDLAIRMESTGHVVRPRRHAVHQLPLERPLSCWRCDAVTTASRNGGSAP